MRLTTMCRGLLLGGAFALLAAGCKDDKTTTMDAGRDAGGGTDSGTTTDAGQDAGQQPVRLRLAHLAFGTGVGDIHLCAYDAAAAPGEQYSLVTSDSLRTGNFLQPTTAIPIPFGSVTSHVDLTEVVLSQLAGKVIHVYRAGHTLPTFTVVNSSVTLATCAPDEAPVATATIGTGAGEVNLIPGHSHTVVVAGFAGPEKAADPACIANAASCPAPFVVTLEDETSFSSGTETRARVVLADLRIGATPGFCHNLQSNLMSAPQNIAPVTTTGLVPFVGVATPTYSNFTPLLPGSGPDASIDPQILTLHLNNGVMNPDAAVPGPCGTSPGFPGSGISPAGLVPNGTLIAAYQARATAGDPVATIRTSLAAGDLTTVFIAPFLTQFIDVAGGNAPCAAGSSATCLPLGGQCASPSASCIWLPTAIPASDEAP